MFIKPNDKIGLIGLNGRGKTTLLKLISGELKVDEGSISMAKDCTIGFLNQDLLSYQSEEPIIAVAMKAFKEAVEIQSKIEKIIIALEKKYSEDLVNKLSHLQEQFEHLNGYSLQSQAEEILEGIGFSTADLHRPLKEFSGGWRMRVMLAQLLLAKPSVLMLDEPTNHLDIPSIEWVESYLRNYNGAVIVVSHDRKFLDNVVSKIVEVTQQQLVSYEGNYSYYLEEKELRETIQQNAFDNQQAKIRQAERFIERFKAKASKARQVKSKEKAINRMNLVEEVVTDSAAVNFKFKFKQRSGSQVISLKSVSKYFDSLKILEKTNATVARGDKIALIGANGKGKSTLLRILSGSEQIDGERKIGYNVIYGFYAQHQLEALHLENDIITELKQEGSDKTEQELRGILGCFLFSDDDQFKKIKVLSGGEKSRVALAKTLISEANFLLLDEPTNHLDFISENILIQALQQYKGSFVVVSHNRYFVSQVANKIWYIENHQIKEYPGTYDEYSYWVETQKQEYESNSIANKAKVQTENGKPKEERGLDVNRELQLMEQRIESLRLEKIRLEEKFLNDKLNLQEDQLKLYMNKIEEINSKMETCTQRWGELVEELKPS